MMLGGREVKDSWGLILTHETESDMTDLMASEVNRG